MAANHWLLLLRPASRNNCCNAHYTVFNTPIVLKVQYLCCIRDVLREEGMDAGVTVATDISTQIHT